MYSFFLAEYASIVLICIFTSILFLGGYLNSVFIRFFNKWILYIFDIINIDYFKYIYIMKLILILLTTFLDG